MAEVKKIGWNEVKVLTTLPGRSGIVALLGKDAVEGLYGIGGWQLHGADTANADAKKFMASYKQKFNVDPDENAANAYSYTDWFVKSVQAAGRGLTAESFSKAAQSVAHQDFTTYSRQNFAGNHVGPEFASIDVVKGGKWIQQAAPMTGLVKN